MAPTESDPSPHANLHRDGEFYVIEGIVDPPVDGDEEVVLSSIQPSEKEAIKRFIWYFNQMDRSVQDITEVRVIDDPEEFLENHKHRVPDHVAMEVAAILERT